MISIYSQEPVVGHSRSIFLAGPTPRANHFPKVPSWRPEALYELNDLGFDGIVFIPEPRTARSCRNSLSFDTDADYARQVDWETKALDLADMILFWIPRNMDTLPGLTTNCEWGRWHRSGKVVLGCPPGAEHMRYLKYQANQLEIPQADTLRGTVELVVNRFARIEALTRDWIQQLP